MLNSAALSETVKQYMLRCVSSSPSVVQGQSQWSPMSWTLFTIWWTIWRLIFAWKCSKKSQNTKVRDRDETQKEFPFYGNLESKTLNSTASACVSLTQHYIQSLILIQTQQYHSLRRPDYIVLRQTGSVAETARNCMQSLHRSRSVTGGMSKGRPASVRLS